ncbi:unnamed protein product [Discula destructiva]
MAEKAITEDLSIDALNTKYIELLERRIAQLELLVNKPAAATAAADAAKEEKPKDNSNRYRYILRKWDKDAGAHKDEEVPSDWFEKPKNQDSAYVYRRIYDPDTGEKDATSEIEVENDELIKVLQDIIGKKYPGISFDTETLVMSSPFPAIIHNWEMLQKHIKSDPDSQVCRDLASMMDRVRSSPELDGYFKLRGGQEDMAKAVTFETVWAAFAPGTLIVVQPFRDTEQIMMIADSPIPYNSARYIRGYIRLWLWAWTWDFDGHELVKVWHPFKIDRFRGTKHVTDLEYIPLDLHVNREALKEKVRKRSQDFLRYTVLCQQGSDQVFQYDGLAYADERKALGNDEPDNANKDDDNYQYKSAQDEDGSSKLVQIKGEVISDAQAYTQNTSSGLPIGPRERGGLTPFVDKQQTASDDATDFRAKVKLLTVNEPLDPNDDNFLIMPPRLLGYATRQRVWGQFSIDQARPPAKGDPQAFRHTLQLNDSYKDMIESQVLAHMQKGKKPITDIIEEKGKGLVLLLHGPPGVGKTLTAETIAKATGKPLFMVSVAEIGLDASRAERKLEKIFTLATKWQAVLLIDEADVFLETRNRHSDAERNALVSVLLRVLEYYEGIIMMTTNRIKAIDVAVISRIHLAVRYTDLEPTQMRNIFKYYLEQLKPDLIHDLPSILHFINQFGHMYDLNGRQIRNVVMAAQAYARHTLNFADLGQESMGVVSPQEPSYPMYGSRHNSGHEQYYGRPGPSNISGNYRGPGPGPHGGYDGAYRGSGGAAGGYSPVPRRPDGKMTAEHLKAVCELTREFQEQLKENSKDQRYNNEVR